jgi:hypothetical protein
MTDIGLL